MSDEIMNTICEDVAAMIQRTRPCFGDIVVGDINDENTGLLEKMIFHGAWSSKFQASP